MDDELKKLAESYEGKPFINAHSAKAVIEIRNKNEPWFWFDLKTPGYFFANFVGKRILKGGNWNTPIWKAPMDTYIAELFTEVPQMELVKTISDNTHPFADYLEIVSQKCHGNNKKDTIITLSSVFYSIVDSEYLFDMIEIPNEKINKFLP